jgi:broad specificity phosphatase PhoE
MKLYIVRHGESMSNIGGYSILVEDPLSCHGEEQAQKLAERLEGLSFDAIYCSPLQRAVQTVLPYAESVCQKVEIWPELAEACWQKGCFSAGLQKAEYVEFYGYPECQNFSFRDGATMRPAPNENYAQGLYRAKEAIDRLLKRHTDTDDSILVVAHGCINSRLIEMLLGIEPVGRFHYDNTGITFLRDDLPEVDGFKVMYSNQLHK